MLTSSWRFVRCATCGCVTHLRWLMIARWDLAMFAKGVTVI